MLCWQFCDWRLCSGQYILGIRLSLCIKRFSLHSQLFILQDQQSITKHGKCRKTTIALKMQLSKYLRPDGLGHDKIPVHLDTAYRATLKPQAALIVLSLTIGNLLLSAGWWLTDGFLMVSFSSYFIEGCLCSLWDVSAFEHCHRIIVSHTS